MYGIDWISWCIHKINGKWLFSIRCSKRQVLARRLEYSNWSISKSTILSLTRYESWFLFDLSLNYKFINSVVKVFFNCIFRIYSFYQFIINFFQIGAFMFPRIFNNSRNTVFKNGKFEICNGSCCHSSCFKIINISEWEPCTPYRLLRSRHDCKTIQVKVIKYNSDRKEAVTKTVNSIKNF